MSTTHYQGKPFDDNNATGLSGGVNQKDALKNVTSTSNDPVNTISLAGQASHDREKGMGPTAFRHKQSADAHPNTRQEKAPGGHREALGSEGPSEEVADSKFVESLNEAREKQQQKGSKSQQFYVSIMSDSGGKKSLIRELYMPQKNPLSYTYPFVPHIAHPVVR